MKDRKEQNPRRRTRRRKMEVDTDTPAVPTPAYLIAALEQATLMAKQLPTTADPSHLLRIHSTLLSAHRHLSLFLSHHHPPQPPNPAPENSFSSTVGGGPDADCETGDGDPMQMEDEQSSRATTGIAVNVNKVEERMRDCFIQNKRPKRPLSPSAVVAEQRQSYEDGVVRGGGALAAELEKLRSLDLIYQFHA